MNYIVEFEFLSTARARQLLALEIFPLSILLYTANAEQMPAFEHGRDYFIFRVLSMCFPERAVTYCAVRLGERLPLEQFQNVMGWYKTIVDKMHEQKGAAKQDYTHLTSAKA